MSTVVPGTVYVAVIPYEDRTGEARRPVVLIGSPSYWQPDARRLVCPITTAAPRPADIALDWQALGLRSPSCVRPRPVIIPKSDIRFEVGHLAADDLEALQAALRDVLGL